MNSPQFTKLPDGIFDPNPAEAADYYIELSGEIKTLIELDRAAFIDLTNSLYSGECPSIIIDRCLDQLALYGTTIIYSGSLKQCLTYSSSYKELGLGVIFKKI